MQDSFPHEIRFRFTINGFVVEEYDYENTDGHTSISGTKPNRRSLSCRKADEFTDVLAYWNNQYEDAVKKSK